MKRKIVQISAIPETSDAYSAVYALCDDGTLWCKATLEVDKWYQIEPIPQDDAVVVDKYRLHHGDEPDSHTPITGHE